MAIDVTRQSIKSLGIFKIYLVDRTTQGRLLTHIYKCTGARFSFCLLSFNFWLMEVVDLDGFYHGTSRSPHWVWIWIHILLVYLESITSAYFSLTLPNDLTKVTREILFFISHLNRNESEQYCFLEERPRLDQKPDSQKSTIVAKRMQSFCM